MPLFRPVLLGLGPFRCLLLGRLCVGLAPGCLEAGWRSSMLLFFLFASHSSVCLFGYGSNHLFNYLTKDLFVYASIFLFIRLITSFIYLSCLFFIRLINDLFMFVCVGIPPRGNVFPGTAVEIKTCYSECSNRELLLSPYFCAVHIADYIVCLYL